MKLATRNTCFALISAIEVDVRAFVGSRLGEQGLTEMLPPDARQAAAKRFFRERGEQSPAGDHELLPYTDFEDLSKILDVHRNVLAPLSSEEAQALSARLRELTSARNRVCHSRPLEATDLPSLLDFAREEVGRSSTTFFAETRGVLRAMAENPAKLIAIEIPKFWAADAHLADHNLPLPDFDETGFLGRQDARKRLTKLLVGSHPVVTVVGEGGVGKTALALRCLYDLLDHPGGLPFDAVVWVSAKTATLTAKGTERIAGAIADTLGVLTKIGDRLMGEAGREPTKVLADILEYMETFRVLLAIDNLETLSSSELRDLLVSVPTGSKVLLTSRVGLGEVEIRFPVEPLDEKTSQDLMRRFARLIGVDSVASSRQVPDLCRRLYHNPLMIKWFVASVSQGAQPEVLLTKTHSQFNEAIRFCFENLFDRLDDGQRLVLDVMQCARQPLSRAELRYLSSDSLDSDHLEAALRSLNNSSIVRRNGSRKENAPDVYQLTDIASQFLNLHAPPKSEFAGNIRRRLQELAQIVQGEAVLRGHYKYELTSLTVETRDHRLCASYLKRALAAANQRDYAGARKLIAEAKDLAPEYSENFRVSAIVEWNCGNAYGAEVDMEAALEIAPRDPLALYTYAQFLSRENQDFQRSLEQVEAALRVDPRAHALLSLKALMLSRLGRETEASAIYEKLLEDLPARFRIQIRDQAAECYRRLAERRREERDPRSQREAIERAFAILDEGFRLNDFDRSTLNRYLRVADAGMYAAAANRDIDYASDCYRRLAEVVRAFGLPERRLRCCKALSDAFGPSCSLVELVQTEGLAEPLGDLLQGGGASGEEMNRVVGQLRLRDSSLAYGFIRTNDGKDWFFHRSDMADSAEWARWRGGELVSFRSGTNERGPCAREVRLGGDL